MPVHDVAATGFGQAADVYEDARPSYPPDAVAWIVEHLRIEPGRRVVDLAAGTGKLTRLLADAGSTLIAAEPVAGMRDTFTRVCPDVPMLACTAELMSFASGSLDAITVAQGFHWFDAPVALTEFARALRSGGRLGLIWNARDRSNDLVDQLWSIMDRVEKRAPWRKHDRWSDSALVEHPEFGSLQEGTFHHAQVMTREQVLDRFRSVSHISVLLPAEQDSVIGEIRGVLDTHPLSVGQDLISIPYRVDAYWCERR